MTPAHVFGSFVRVDAILFLVVGTISDIFILPCLLRDMCDGKGAIDGAGRQGERSETIYKIARELRYR